MSAADPLDPVLVTGGAGFVGACVVRALVGQGRPVHVLLRGESRPWRLADILDRVVVHRADLLDADATRSVVRSVRPGTVLHLAAHGAYESHADAPRILQTNILGTHHLLEAAAAVGVQVFVSTGSSSEYGFNSEPMREDDRLEPNSFYAVAKAAQTHLCALAARKSRMAVVVYRLFSAYGPWEEPTRLMPTLIRRARAGLPLEMVCPDTARDFVYIEDVVEALLDLQAAARLNGQVINLGTGRETTLREVTAAVLGLTGSRSVVRWGAMRARHWDADHWSADPSRALRLLGWTPRHDLRQGLARMAAWMQSIGDDYGPSATRPAA